MKGELSGKAAQEFHEAMGNLLVGLTKPGLVTIAIGKEQRHFKPDDARSIASDLVRYAAEVERVAADDRLQAGHPD